MDWTVLVITFGAVSLSLLVGLGAFLVGKDHGFRRGVKHGLELSWQRLDDATGEALDRLDRRGRVAPQPLAIQYSIRTGGDGSSTPLSGRMVFPEFTRADWPNLETQQEIRARLRKAC